MIGYSFWGFLGDEKYNENEEKISTPDGNAFYSWSIIRELQKRGKNVCAIMPDRDIFGYKLKKENLFSAFAKKERSEAYKSLLNVEIGNFDYSFFEYIIIEWRWEIKGRNDEETKLKDKKSWQPDLEITKNIMSWCKEKNIPFVIFDLDYKLTEEDIDEYGIEYVIELGDKWKESKKVKSKQVKIPFDFSCINEKELKNDFKYNLVYVGNRYERDWCIDKYIPEDLEDCIIYGNWKESGRDSCERWNKLSFGDRVQTSEMYNVYSDSVATILLAKEEYCKMHFMTARIIEAVFYGCVPFFIEEYGNETIIEYAGKYAEFLKVSSKKELNDKIKKLKNDVSLRNEIIMYLREHLRFMDCKFFVDDIENFLGK